MTIEEIKKRLAELDAKRERNSLDMIEINRQIDEANALKQMHGIHSDKTWLSRAKYALRLKGALHQELLLERGELSRELKFLQSRDENRELLKNFKSLVELEIGEKRCFELFKNALELIK